MRLSDYNLEMEETAGVGNCFFRAVSRMVYASGEFYFNVRSQAVEYLRHHRQEFEGFITNDFTSIDNYITSSNYKSNFWRIEYRNTHYIFSRRHAYNNIPTNHE